MTEDNILLIGHYGAGNAGDDAMALGAAEYISQKGYNVHIVVRDIDRFPSKGYFTKISFGLTELLQEYLWMDKLVFAGGSRFHDYGENKIIRYRNVFYFLFLILSAKILRREVYLIGQGFGPINDNLLSFLFRICLVLSDYISVRDNHSSKYSCLSNQDIHLGFDLSAPLLHKIGSDNKTQKNTKKSTLGISVTPAGKNYFNDSTIDKEIIDRISESVDNNAAIIDEIIIFVFHSGTDHSDILLSEDLLSRLDSQEVSIIKYKHNPVDFLKRVGKCDAFIGMKYHSIIFSFYHSLPTTIIPYHPKCEQFAKFVDYPNDLVLSYPDTSRTEIQNAISMMFSTNFKSSVTNENISQLMDNNWPEDHLL